MKIKLHEIPIRDLIKDYQDKGDDGVFGYGGRLNIRPKYQREFVYKDNQRDEVIRTVRKNFPLNTLYWSVNADGTFEVLDGQQRIISICKYVAANKFSVKMHKSDESTHTFEGLTNEEKEQILNYPLMVYFCEGTEREKLDWFQVINIAGVVLKPQELRNAIYTGPWLADAKKYFSKNDCMAKNIAEKYINGSPIRQEFLEKILKWKSGGEDKIAEYMSTHQHDSDATELKNYFEEIFGNQFDGKTGWVQKIFPKYRKEMKGLEWGQWYNEHKNDDFDAEEIEARISEMMKNEEIENKKWIYEYILTKNEKYLNVRQFSDSQKTTMYEQQQGHCANAKCPQGGKKWEIYEMDADHIVPWSKGGKTELNNWQMLCKKCNQEKSNK